MKKGNVLTFFPGKGIFTNPDSGLDPVFSVYKKEDAEKILEYLSETIFHDKKVHSKSEIKPLILSHGRISPKKPQINLSNNSHSFIFSEQCKGLREA